MWELDYKKKAEYCRIDAFELWCWRRLLRVPWTCKEIQPVNPKEKQSWIIIERTDAEAEASILWPPDVKNWLFGKDPDAGKDWRWEEKGMMEDEMVGWHHRLEWHEFEEALKVSNGQGGLACCSPWGCKELDTTEWLNWSECYSKSNQANFFYVCPLPKYLSGQSNTSVPLRRNCCLVQQVNMKPVDALSHILMRCQQ